MFIKDKEVVLAEKNYEGNTLKLVTDENIIELHKKLNELQVKANPFLEKMEALTPIMDPIYTKIGEHQRAITELKAEMQPTRDEYDANLKEVEAIDQEAQLIKNKIQPLAENLFAGEFSEFQKAIQIVVKDDKLYVEVADKLEDFIKTFRATNPKK